MKLRPGSLLTLIGILALLLLPACSTPAPQPVTFDAQAMTDYNGTSTIVDGFNSEITTDQIEEAFKTTCTNAVPSIFDGNIRGKMCNFATVIRYSLDNGSMQCEHASMAPTALDLALKLDLKKVKSFGVAIFPIPEEDSVIADAVCK